MTVSVCVIILWVFGVECSSVDVCIYSTCPTSSFVCVCVCVCVCADCHDFVDVDNVHHHHLVTLYGA